MIDSVVATAANVHDSQVIGDLLHGDEDRARNREKSRVRASVEHTFGVIRQQLGEKGKLLI